MISLYDNLWLDADENCFMLKSDDRQYHAVTSPGTPGQGASNKEDSI